jgi:hypothetical protein
MNQKIMTNLKMLQSLIGEICYVLSVNPRKTVTLYQWDQISRFHQAAVSEQQKILPVSGICRYCDCTDGEACMIAGIPCHWIDRRKTVCSNPDCAAQWKAQKKKRKAAKSS